VSLRLLVPSIGRKRSLAKLLRAELSQTGGVLYGADTDSSAPALRDVDIPVNLPAFEAGNFWDVFNGVVREDAINAVIPVRDAELVGWAERSEAGLLPVATLLSQSETLAICRDKRRLYEVARECGIACPEWTTSFDKPIGLTFPCVVKPVAGCGSLGVHIVDGPSALMSAVADADDAVMAQAFHDGIEYSVDCFASSLGELRDCCVRERRVVMHGECVSGDLVNDPELVQLCRRMAKRMRFRGVFNVQFIRDVNGAWLIDLNPRFPGGIAITERAGWGYIVRTVKMLMPNAVGRDCNFGDKPSSPSLPV
jgi:carbamoyl-phosphate synthase large subunit